MEEGKKEVSQLVTNWELEQPLLQDLRLAALCFAARYSFRCVSATHDAGGEGEQQVASMQGLSGCLKNQKSRLLNSTSDIIPGCYKIQSRTRSA